jgi:hypothetical protein
MSRVRWIVPTLGPFQTLTRMIAKQIPLGNTRLLIRMNDDTPEGKP